MPILDEHQSRVYLASEAKYIGRGGLTKVSKLSGVSRVTINVGVLELETILKDGDKTNGWRTKKENRFR